MVFLSLLENHPILNGLVQRGPIRKAFHVNTEVEEEIKTGLKGNEHKQHEAVCKAYDRFAAPLASYIRENVAPTLDSHELTTAVDNVFIDLAKKPKRGILSLMVH